MERIEHNIETGETVVIQLTDDEVSAAEANAQIFAQDQAATVPTDPIEKLKSFLSANPDVAEALK